MPVVIALQKKATRARMKGAVSAPVAEIYSSVMPRDGGITVITPKLGCLGGRSLLAPAVGEGNHPGFFGTSRKTIALGPITEAT